MRNETRRSWDGSRVREALFPYLSHHVAPHGSRLRRVVNGEGRIVNGSRGAWGGVRQRVNGREPSNGRDEG